MKFNSKIVKILSTAFLMASLVACGTTDKDSVNGSPKVEDTDGTNAGIVAGEFDVNVENTADATYKITIMNDSEKDQTLTFHSGQRYEYQIKDKEGNVLYTYSADKSFTMEIKEMVLKPGEVLEFDDINISEGLVNIEPGTYTIDLWATALEVADDKTSLEFVHTAVMDPIDLPTQRITITGQIDSSSVEATNDKGEIEVFRLSEKFLGDGKDGLVIGKEVEVQYSTNEAGQKVIEEIIAAE